MMEIMQLINSSITTYNFIYNFDKKSFSGTTLIPVWNSYIFIQQNHSSFKVVILGYVDLLGFCAGWLSMFEC